ncbi:MAG TPA: helix-turn-helix domain-containing protein [Acidimicrobiales bacterium]
MAPTSDTRQRILEVARELFTEQGYDATSLRQIAERLGFTKAALYYHFQSKEQLLRTLLEPVGHTVGEFFGRLEAAEGLEGWAAALDWVIDRMERELPLFRMLQRNRAAASEVGWQIESDREHVAMHDRLERAVAAKAGSLGEQVRMVAALGAVTGFDDWAPGLLEETPMAELGVELKAVVRDILCLPRSAVGSGAGGATGVAGQPA